MQEAKRIPLGQKALVPRGLRDKEAEQQTQRGKKVNIRYNLRNKREGLGSEGAPKPLKYTPILKPSSEWNELQRLTYIYRLPVLDQTMMYKFTDGIHKKLHNGNSNYTAVMAIINQVVDIG